MLLQTSDIFLMFPITALIPAGSEVSVVLLQAVGETWDKFPELKFLALKRMYKYMVCSRPLVMS